MKSIILASGSPRRKQLLKQIKLKFKTCPANVNEEIIPNEKPQNYVKRIAIDKAKTAALQHPCSIVITADTIVIFQNKIIGKPKSHKDAIKILQLLSGKKHYVITGFCVFDSKSKIIVFKTIKTTVYIKKLTQQEIINYVNTGEPFDKAGGYGIQQLGSVLIEKINGDYYNVVGLPLCELVKILKRFQINIP